MQPKDTVVYAHQEYDMTVEQRVFSALDIEVIALSGLDAPGADAALSKADALVVTLQKVSAAVMDRMPRCKIVSRLGVGFDNVDLAAASERGIQVTNVPDYGVEEVSTHAMALMLSLLRGITPLTNSTHGGAWDISIAQPIRRFSQQTVGVLGFGRIGRAFAARARGFGVRLIACDPFVDAATIAAHGAEAVDEETLFRQSDFISLHLPLNTQTRHIVNARSLALMKPTASIVNTARGGLVDEAALLAAVRAGALKGAGLDVLSSEPPARDDPVLAALLAEPRILVTPHFAWYSEDAMIDLRTRAAEEVVRALTGQPPRSPVNQPRPPRAR